MTLLNRFLSRVREQWFRAHGVKIDVGNTLGAYVSVEPGFRDGRKGDVSIGPRCELGRGACLHAWGGRINLGENVFVGPYAVIYGQGTVEIGSGSLVSMHCRILSSNHTIPPSAVTIRSQPDVLLPTRIGRDVWLGAGVTVLGGVTIGDGCVVGAGAVVTSDLPPHCVAMGVPARVVRSRH